mgnify:CR=1 FL=1
MKTNKKLNKIKKLIISQFNNSGKKKLIIGISGGIDSAVCLELLVSWFGKDKISAYYLPIENSSVDYNDILLISNKIGININKFDLTDEFIKIKNKFNFKNQININNIKSRLRAIFLYGVSFENDGLVVGCLNYDEYYLGYFTKYGDSSADIFPLINFCKSEIYEIANWYDLPKKIINKPPSAGLYNGQTDENELGLKYTDIDKFLLRKKINPTIISKIKEIKKKNSHKHLLNKFLKTMKSKKDLFILIFTILGFAILISILVISSVFLSNSLKHFQKGLHDIYFKYVFGLGSLVGISIFLFLLLSLNFASFLSNKKISWKSIFKKKVE